MVKEFDTIHVRLLEGVETFVPCKAKKLDDETYEIIENQYLDLENDATSIWEFFPGDIVKCEFKDHYLLANQLLSSSFPQRKLFELMFMLVSKSGKVNICEIESFYSEIEILYKKGNSDVLCHPIIKKWLNDNYERFKQM